MDAEAEAARPSWRELAGRTFDVAVVGGGIAGMATACRLQARGLATAVLEAHGSVGGCAGSFRRRGFSFDVGATTLVDFEPGGVGGEWLRSIGLALPEAELLPGYLAWLPDRTVRLDRDPARWQAERCRLGDSAAHRHFWATVDRLTRAFWAVSRGGGGLPVRTLGQAFRGVRLLGPARLPLLRYLGWTLGDLLRGCGLRDERPLVGLLSMLVEDTVHATVDEAPLPNAVLGTTIRGAGLSRHRGGMRGFWRAVSAHYRVLGGTLALGTPVERAERSGNHWRLEIPRGTVIARQVVSAVPIDLTARLFPREVGEAARRRQQHVRLRLLAGRRGKRPGRAPRGDALDALRSRLLEGPLPHRGGRAQAGPGRPTPHSGAAGPSQAGGPRARARGGRAADLRALHPPARRRGGRLSPLPRQRQPARRAPRPRRAVPSHHLPRMAERLEPVLREHGVEPVRVP